MYPTNHPTQTVKGALVDETIFPEGGESKFYLYFDFSGISSKEDVWVFLNDAVVNNLYEDEEMVAGKSKLVGVPR